MYSLSFTVIWTSIFIALKRIVSDFADPFYISTEGRYVYRVFNQSTWRMISAYLFEVMFIIWIVVIIFLVVIYGNQILDLLQKREEEEQKRKNDILAYLAHDLRTPLTSIKGYTYLLTQMDLEVNQEAKEYIRIIRQKSEQLEGMLDEFFEITKLETGCISLDLVTIDIVQMLGQIIYEYEPILKEKQFNIISHLDTPAVVECDPNLMERVFDNLIRNAIKYAQDSGILQVSSKIVNQQIHISFLNQSEPIEEEALIHMFDTFVRLDEARGMVEGSGMGLAIVKDIIELHKGEIWAQYHGGYLEIQISLNIIKSS